MASFKYLKNKGLGKRVEPKSLRETFLTDAEVKKILAAVEQSKDKFNSNWYRDYAAIYLGFMFGLRVTEACMLERRHFDEIASKEAAHIPTLKQAPRIPYNCFKCSKRTRVSAERIGQEFPCPRCGAMNLVVHPRRPISMLVPEKDPPVIEGEVVDFVVEYLEKHMRPDQRWLFESRPGVRISSVLMGRIFNTHAAAAGLSPILSWHSLRHGRAAVLYSTFKNLILVRDCLRQKTTKMAERYAHLDLEELQKTKAVLNRRAFKTVATRKEGPVG
jgi:integrase